MRLMFHVVCRELQKPFQIYYIRMNRFFQSDLKADDQKFCYNFLVVLLSGYYIYLSILKYLIFHHPMQIRISIFKDFIQLLLIRGHFCNINKSMIGAVQTFSLIYFGTVFQNCNESWGHSCNFFNLCQISFLLCITSFQRACLCMDSCCVVTYITAQ